MTFKHAVRCQTSRFQQDLIFSTWIEFIRPPDHTAMKCTLYMVCSISYHAGVPAMPTIPYVDCLHSSGGEISLAGGMIQLGNWLGASAPLLFWFSRTQNEKSLTPLKITSACSIKPPVSDYFTKHRCWIRFHLVLEFWVRYYDFNTFFLQNILHTFFGETILVSNDAFTVVVSVSSDHYAAFRDISALATSTEQLPGKE